MLQCKGIKKISELKNGFTPRWVEPDFISSSLKCFSFSKLCQSVSSIKGRGYSFEWIMTILLSMPFIDAVTVNSMLNGCIKHQIEAGKDTFYRLKNNPGICWRLVLLQFASKFCALANNRKTNSCGTRCLIFDDSLIAKTGRRIEKVSWVWDHVTQRYLLGFKLLVMGYWDGTSFLPVDFSMHRELGKNQEKPFGLKKKEFKKQYKKVREKDSYAYKRAVEADMSKIDCAIKMFRRAMSWGFMVDYVLMDSWFTCDAFINVVQETKKQTVHLIGMYKTVKSKFLYQGELHTYSQIRNMIGKTKRCRKLGFHYSEALVEFKGKPLKLFFSKQGKNGNWKVFLCTNTDLSFIKMIEIYQTRWTIEVFFKESKQLLGLERCQSNDFDAQIADTTITMIQYILLTMRYRVETYETMNGLFSNIKESCVQQRLNQRLWGLFIELLQIIEAIFVEIDEDQLMQRIFNDENVYNRIANLIYDPESIGEAA
jgi:predicted nucleic acid-binding Zn finger protein